MKLMIIRHGDPDYSIDSLTEKGWREAVLLANRLVNTPIDAFYLSPLGRAQATARPTLESLKCNGETLLWMREFEGCIISPYSGNERNCWDLPPSLWCADERCFHPTEWKEFPLYAESTSVGSSYAKVVAGVDELLARYGCVREGRLYRGGEDKTIALICHFALAMVVISHILGIPMPVAVHNFYLAPTSVTTLELETDAAGGGHFRAIGIGDISHLYVGDEPMSYSGMHPNFEK